MSIKITGVGTYIEKFDYTVSLSADGFVVVSIFYNSEDPTSDGIFQNTNVVFRLTPDAFLNPYQNYTDNDRYNILSDEASYISETLASARQGTKASIIIDKRQKVYVKRNSIDKHDYTGYMYKGKSK